MLYYTYKFYQPRFGGADYQHYVKMYLDPLSQEVQNPFRTRKISAFITYLVARTGVYYPADIAYAPPLVSQRIFFSALLSNYLALVATATVCSYITRQRGLVAIMGGTLVLLGFGTLNSVLTGLTEGWAWLLVALGFYFYSRGKFAALWAVVLISALQRETIPILFGVFALVDWWQMRRTDPPAAKARMVTCAICALSFGFYLALRAFDAGTGPASQQLTLPMMVHSIARFRLNNEWIFRVIVSQNLFFLGAFLLICLRKAKQPAMPYLAHISACIVVFTACGLLAGINDNVGRILQVLTPVVSPLMAVAFGRLRL